MPPEKQKARLPLVSWRTRDWSRPRSARLVAAWLLWMEPMRKPGCRSALLAGLTAGLMAAAAVAGLGGAAWRPPGAGLVRPPQAGAAAAGAATAAGTAFAGSETSAAAAGERVHGVRAPGEAARGRGRPPEDLPEGRPPEDRSQVGSAAAPAMPPVPAGPGAPAPAPASGFPRREAALAEVPVRNRVGELVPMNASGRYAESLHPPEAWKSVGNSLVLF